MKTHRSLWAVLMALTLALFIAACGEEKTDSSDQSANTGGKDCGKVVLNEQAWAGSTANTYIAKNVLESVRLLANVSRLLADRTVDGIVAHRERAREYAESSPSVVTPLNKYIGYEEAAKVAKKALAEQKTIRQAVLDGGYVERGELTEEQLDEALDVLRMTRP